MQQLTPQRACAIDPDCDREEDRAGWTCGGFDRTPGRPARLLLATFSPTLPPGVLVCFCFGLTPRVLPSFAFRFLVEAILRRLAMWSVWDSGLKAARWLYWPWRVPSSGLEGRLRGAPARQDCDSPARSNPDCWYRQMQWLTEIWIQTWPGQGHAMDGTTPSVFESSRLESFGLKLRIA